MRATRRRSRPLIEEALTASRETKAIDFEEEFDPSDRRSLCETLMFDDLVFENGRCCEEENRRDDEGTPGQ